MVGTSATISSTDACAEQAVCRRPIKMSPLWDFGDDIARVYPEVFGVTVRLTSGRQYRVLKQVGR
jgi:hypothetical protein